MEAPRAKFIGIKTDALNVPEALIVARLSERQKTTVLAPPVVIESYAADGPPPSSRRAATWHFGSLEGSTCL
jgi:hypothetical protein